MTEYLHAFWLAILQGLTEFLPISSSGHLILLPALFGWTDQGLAFDVAVHLGSLLAVLLYFRNDVSQLLFEWSRSLVGGPQTAYSRLAWSIAIATVMVAVAGLLLEGMILRTLRAPVPVALATIGFGLLLWWADVSGRQQRELDEMRWRDVLMIGFAQTLALVPGTSRSGVTITMGLAMGLTREAAARFSFLMAIPVILLAGGWQTRKLLLLGEPVDWGLLLFGTLISGIAAYACIHWFLEFLKRFSMLPFVIYRLVLGAVLLWIFL